MRLIVLSNVIGRPQTAQMISMGIPSRVLDILAPKRLDLRVDKDQITDVRRSRW